MSQRIHILLRFSANMFGVDDPIGLHQRMIEKNGEVWFGKMGKVLGWPNVAIINAQCSEKADTYLYLVEKTAVGYKVHKGKILEVTRDKPLTGERIPQYYAAAGLLPYIKIWFRLAELLPVDSEILRKLRIVTSGFTVTDTLPASMAGMFIVQEYL